MQKDLKSCLLYTSSIKFSKNGRRIFVNMKKKEESVIIEISDEGMGMSEEFKTHLFEKFKRGEMCIRDSNNCF